MEDEVALRRQLLSLDGKGYRSYKELGKEYRIGDFTLFIDHVQGDPLASPSSMRVRLPQSEAGFPEDTYYKWSRSVALRDFIARHFWESARTHAKAGRASGDGGAISIPRPGQTVLDRSSVAISREHVEVRFGAALPGAGRKLAGRLAAEMLLDRLPRIVSGSMRFGSLNEKRLYRHVNMVEDAVHIRMRLEELGLVAFIADGSILPRQAGHSQYPMQEGVVPFRSPDSLRMRMRTPNGGDVWGMGVPEGVTIIVGGGYHGKSTLLNAISQGVWNHIPGDGRELAVTRSDAVKVGVEDGRSVASVDISPFVRFLPGGRDTVSFSTQNASGSTSQAAGIMEALEVDCGALLIDEDRSAPNFMVRDRRMQELVPRSSEPITPFIDRVRLLWERMGVSTVMVVGGSGEYLDIADTVLMMDSYAVRDVTEEARRVAAEIPSQRLREDGPGFSILDTRRLWGFYLDARRGRKDPAIDARSLRLIQFGTGELDLSACEQLVEISQTNTIAEILARCISRMDGITTMRELVDGVITELVVHGLDHMGRLNGERAEVREFEIAAAINRLENLLATRY